MLFPYIDVFVDGGGNSRAWVDRYLPKLPKFHKVYVFEPNPKFHPSYNQSKFTLIKKAIWTEDCRKPFYVSKDERQVASSLLSEKLCKVDSEIIPYWYDEPLEVECIDFSRWIEDNIKPYWNLTLKLDIEGAEYDVLSHMIECGTITRVKKLFVEFHLDTLPGKKDHHDKLIGALTACGVEINHWD